MLKGPVKDLNSFREIEKDIAFSSNLKKEIQYEPLKETEAGFDGRFFDYSVTLSENAD